MNRLLKTIAVGFIGTVLLSMSVVSVNANTTTDRITKTIDRHNLKNNSEAYVDLGQVYDVRNIEIVMHDHDESYNLDLYATDRNGYETKLVTGSSIDTNSNGDDVCEYSKNDNSNHEHYTLHCYKTKSLEIGREIKAIRFYIYGDSQDDGHVHIKTVVLNLRQVPVAVTPTPTPVPVQENDFCSTDAKFPQVFPDVPMHSVYYEHVQELECHNVVHGYSDNTFRPYMPVTRGEMAKIISNGMRMEENKYCGSFRDVPTSNKFYNYISTLKCRGVINGYSDGSFRPDSYVTRAEAMKFIVNGARIRTNNSNFLANSNNYNVFADMNMYDPLYNYVIGGQSLNIYQDINNNQFRPSNFITRAELSLYLNLVRREIDKTVINYTNYNYNTNYYGYNNYYNNNNTMYFY